MDNEKFLYRCKGEIQCYIKSEYDLDIDIKDIYVVWSCKTLQNNKALLSTTISDGLYYEITYNGDKKELYFDVYKKVLNKCYRGITNAII